MPGGVADEDLTVLDALQHTGAVRRLGRVSQAGAPSLFLSTRSLTRLEHSMGVMRLARRADLEIDHQITGLLHDVTHSAFSHTLDHVLANAEEDTHERLTDRLMRDPELIEIVGAERLGAVTQAITTKPPWLRLLDAVDYTLRDLRRAQLLDVGTTRQILNAITNVDGQACFADAEAAWTLVLLMDQTGEQLYGNQVELFMHSALAELITRGIETGAVDLDDVLTNDDAGLLVQLAEHPALAERLAKFRALNPQNLQERRHRRIRSKVRLLDPPVRVGRADVIPLSEVQPDWWKVRRRAEQRAESGVAVLTQK